MSKKVHTLTPKSNDPYLRLDAQLLKRMHNIMVRGRLLEERLIKMSKGGEGFFWIGGPGEEGFNVPLGFQVKKGEGVQFDYLHLHYRSSGIALAMGAEVIDTIRQMRTTATDPYSRGRNFVNHYAVPEWNIMPVSPTIETQYSTAIGTGIAQAHTKGTDSLTIVNGGDAGTAEGDFHSCLVWANRPALPLPILMIVVNNGFGISTPAAEQHGEKNIADWAKTFDMPGKTINGNDPVESYFAIQEAMAYIRKERRPYLLEAKTSRLYGHSSSSGANRIPEPDCIKIFEEQMLKRNLIDEKEIEEVWTSNRNLIDDAYQQVKQEPYPEGDDIWYGVFAEGLDDTYPKKGGS
ncbi:MAG: thiamine pyrophosphate-dependent dehydrogenase E1 component subunit alpha [Deltaproteobacteria bacterium]|nr:thiamine pyrophosphate-dependent dehydrogenase E1 component subunit alpha [Deltaproteobacteria bacterium]